MIDISKLRLIACFYSFVVELISCIMLNFFSKQLKGNPPIIATRIGVNAMLTTNKQLGCGVDSRMAITKTPLHISV